MNAVLFPKQFLKCGGVHSFCEVAVKPGCIEPLCGEFLDIMKFLNARTLAPLKRTSMSTLCNEDVSAVDLGIMNFLRRLSASSAALLEI